MRLTVHRSRGGRRRKLVRAAQDAYLSYKLLPSPGPSEPERAVTIPLEPAVASGGATQGAVSVPRAGYHDIVLALP